MVPLPTVYSLARPALRMIFRTSAATAAFWGGAIVSSSAFKRWLSSRVIALPCIGGYIMILMTGSAPSQAVPNKDGPCWRDFINRTISQVLTASTVTDNFAQAIRR
jgi:hypothetical protein